MIAAIVAAVCDEIAFWDDPDSANPDVEVVNALRPGMATVPGALLLAISTPHARGGALWSAYDAHYGRDGDPVLVWRADTASMNDADRSLLPESDHIVGRLCALATQEASQAAWGRTDSDCVHAMKLPAIGRHIVYGQLKVLGSYLAGVRCFT